MKINNDPPFEKYDCYKVFHKKMGRWQVCLVPLDEGKRRTLLYSKFLMSVQLGRILEPDEEVDHKDGDKGNDALSNLEIVTREENGKRYALSHPAKPMEFVCPECGSTFYKPKNQRAEVKGRKRTFCSRQCSGKYNGKRNYGSVA